MAKERTVAAKEEIELDVGGNLCSGLIKTISSMNHLYPMNMILITKMMLKNWNTFLWGAIL